MNAFLNPRVLAFIFTVLLLMKLDAHAQTYKIDRGAFGDDSRHWYGIKDKGNVINPKANQPVYKDTQIAEVADNILLYQKSNGGWPKNYDVFAILTDDQKDSLVKAKNVLNTTYDNGTTYTQITCLANVYTVTKVEKYKQAVLKGLDFVLTSQYANGGWPQYYPLENNYSRCITFNDGVFEGIISMLKDITDQKPEYAFVDAKHLEKLKAAYAKGIDCILKTQINDLGKPTAWCQQYDEVKLTPAWARKFEPASICNSESVGIVLFLMSIEHPSKPIIEAVKNAVDWFKDSKILYTRVKTIAAPPLETAFRTSKSDRVVVIDSTAPPIWTRYYELKTHKPMFCNRTSVVVYTLAEVDRERRDGYGWYTYNPQKAIDRFPKWAKKVGLL